MLAELLEQEGVDVIQTEGGKSSNPSKPGVLGLIEKVYYLLYILKVLFFLKLYHYQNHDFCTKLGNSYAGGSIFFISSSQHPCHVFIWTQLCHGTNGVNCGSIWSGNFNIYLKSLINNLEFKSFNLYFIIFIFSNEIIYF